MMMHVSSTSPPEDVEILLPEFDDASQQPRFLYEASTPHGQEWVGEGDGKEHQTAQGEGHGPVDAVRPVPLQYRAATGAQKGCASPGRKLCQQVTVMTGDDRHGGSTGEVATESGFCMHTVWSARPLWWLFRQVSCLVPLASASMESARRDTSKYVILEPVSAARNLMP